MSEFLITKLVCKGCNNEIPSYGACLEITQVKWINGYWSSDSKSEFYCQECAPLTQITLQEKCNNES